VWPHSITIGVGGKAIAIGTDSPEVMATLEPWRIDQVGEPTDYCLELSPAAPGAGRPRPLPGLYHGSTALLRSRDTDRLTTTLLRVLSSHARAPGDHQVRVALMPVLRDGVAMLLPRASVGAVPDRWLLAQGIDAIYTVSSLVDAENAQVLIDPPLGTAEEPGAFGFGGWWLPPRYWEGELSPGFAVAEVMTLVTDVSAVNAASTLRAVARLVERAHPVFAPSIAEGVKENLIQALEGIGGAR
jgi:hypothetical protein